jgi:hypothetical protein
LQAARDEELRGAPYDWTAVDALLEIGSRASPAENDSSGLVEMQRLFMELARKQGLLPAAVREESPTWQTKRRHRRSAAARPRRRSQA